jgi:hypothetical protein
MKLSISELPPWPNRLCWFKPFTEHFYGLLDLTVVLLAVGCQLCAYRSSPLAPWLAQTNMKIWKLMKCPVHPYLSLSVIRHAILIKCLVCKTCLSIISWWSCPSNFSHNLLHNLKKRLCLMFHIESAPPTLKFEYNSAFFQFVIVIL